jgi:hypothetical protein
MPFFGELSDFEVFEVNTIINARPNKQLTPLFRPSSPHFLISVCFSIDV